MTMLRLLNPQGIAGLAAAVILALLLIAAKIDARHFRKQSAQFAQLYRLEAKAHAATIANVRIATERARAADRANAERVEAAQGQINERIANDFQARLADARARADRLRGATTAASDPGGGRSTPVPGLPGSAPGTPQTAGEDRLPDAERLIATEQAIQLEALIDWVRAQAEVERGRPPSE